MPPFWARFKHVVLIIKENRSYDQVFGDIDTGAGHVGGDPHLVNFGDTITPNHHALAHQFGLMDNLYCSGTISADGHHWVNESFADDYDERAMNTYPRSYLMAAAPTRCRLRIESVFMQAALESHITPPRLRRIRAPAELP